MGQFSHTHALGNRCSHPVPSCFQTVRSFSSPLLQRLNTSTLQPIPRWYWHDMQLILMSYYGSTPADILRNAQHHFDVSWSGSLFSTLVAPSLPFPNSSSAHPFPNSSSAHPFPCALPFTSRLTPRWYSYDTNTIPCLYSGRYLEKCTSQRCKCKSLEAASPRCPPQRMRHRLPALSLHTNSSFAHRSSCALALPVSLRSHILTFSRLEVRNSGTLAALRPLQLSPFGSRACAVEATRGVSEDERRMPVTSDGALHR
jgi:hypothetical protein